MNELLVQWWRMRERRWNTVVIILSVLNVIISYKHLRAFFSLQGRVEMKKLFDTGRVGLWKRVKELDICS